LRRKDIQNNNNKFYVIQILHPVGNTNSCQVFTRWGRVGERGQSALTGTMGAAAAIAAFRKMFKSKSATDWEKRHNMVARSGKHTPSR
jgi:poly [ADP-ribose] polymerase